MPLSFSRPTELIEFIVGKCEPDLNCGCLLWPTASELYYGRLVVDAEEWAAHRAMYQATFGQIPPGLNVLHKCDTRPCCNALHLEAGSQSKNMEDAYIRGRRCGWSGGERVAGPDHPAYKLSDEQIAAIRADARLGKIIAPEYGISVSYVSTLRTGRRRMATRHDFSVACPL